MSAAIPKTLKKPVAIKKVVIPTNWKKQLIIYKIKYQIEIQSKVVKDLTCNKRIKQKKRKLFFENLFFWRFLFNSYQSSTFLWVRRLK